MNRTGYAQTLAQLHGAQKSSRGASPYSRYVNRPLGRHLACLAHLAGLTPDKVTMISAGFTFSGILALALFAPTFTVGTLAASALVLGYALDSADGQLARLQGGGSVAGEWLDHIVDCIKISTIHLAVLVGLYRFESPPTFWYVVALAFSVVGNVIFFGKILNDQLRRNHAAAGDPRTSGSHFAWYKVAATAPRDYGVLALVVFLWPLPSLFLPLYLFLFLISAAFLATSLPRWLRNMRELGA